MCVCVCVLGEEEEGCKNDTYDLLGDFGVLGAARDGLDPVMVGESIRHES